MPYTGSYAADDQSLFVRTMTFPGDLLKDSAATREITTLATSVYASVHPLRVDDAWLYWSEESRGQPGSPVRRIAKGGGAPQTLATTTVITALELDDTHVYFWSRNAINRVDKNSGEVTCVTVTAAAPVELTELTVGNTYVYWSDGQSIWRVPK